jgi:phospholipid/cholesterol/gamma-HCH transport system permease protein
MSTAIENLGELSINFIKTIQDDFSFSIKVIAKMLNRKSYNPAMRMVLINQIYFTSVQILPLFIVASIIFGTLVIGIIFQVIKNFGLANYMGHLLMGFVVTELSPIITVLLIALRSGSAINTEIAVMKVNNEMKTLEMFNIDDINYLYLPRIINGIISIVLLSSLFSISLLLSGLLFSKIMFGMSFDAYTNVLLSSALFYDILILILKCCTFGFFIILIPIRSGLSVSNELTSIPIAVLHGMLRIFIAIIVIEVLSLIIRSI